MLLQRHLRLVGLLRERGRYGTVCYKVAMGQGVVEGLDAFPLYAQVISRQDTGHGGASGEGD